MGLMGGLYLLLIAGLRYFRTGEVHQRVLQEAAVAIRKITREVSNTGPDYLDPSGLPAAFIFRSADPMAGAGSAGNWTYTGPTLQWQKWVCYSRDATTSMLNRTELAASWNVTLPVTLPGLAAMTSVPAGNARTALARGVTNLQFGLDLDRLLVNVTTEDQTGSRTGQVTSCFLQSKVRMENQVEP